MRLVCSSPMPAAVPCTVPLLVKAVVRDLGKTKSAKQKAAKEARKIVEMKGKQIKDELLLAMIQLFTKPLDEDSVEAVQLMTLFEDRTDWLFAGCLVRWSHSSKLPSLPTSIVILAGICAQ